MNKNREEKALVLIVDDQPMNIHVLSKLLSGSYDILVANSGHKALELALGEEQPDLILLDVNMPDLDGYEVCRRIKADPRTKDIAVVFITARNDTEDEEKGFLLGAADYIIKPFQPAVVRARIRNQVNLKIRTDLLEKIARTDGLTGIPNRMSYEENIEVLWKHCVRNRLHFGVIMIDIDCFKAYNDNYGHGAGDECLRLIAKTLDTHIRRPLEMIARYGGEEFVVLLPDTDSEGVRYIADTMREGVLELELPHEYSPVAPFVTISLGYAIGSVATETTPEHVVERADEALYLAKRNGRNRVEKAL